MTELDDNELLRHYLDGGSEEAFATLVVRHLNKIYSVALRQTNNPSQAQEITQAVFVILARKARSLPKTTILSAWLYQTARLAAITLTRSEIRRARREQEAHMQSSADHSSSDPWDQIAPVLDSAMSDLNTSDRAAIVLRFLDGKSLKEVATAMSSTEEAAKKRVRRALEKLRLALVRRGATVPALALAAALTANSVQAAPPSLLSATLTCVALNASAPVGSSTITLINAALKFMAWTQAKTALVTAGVVLLATGITTTLVTTRGFGLWSDAPARVQPRTSSTSSQRINTQGLNRAHRIPDPLYTHADGDETTRRYLQLLLARVRPELTAADTIKSAGQLTGDDLTNRTLYIYGTPASHSLFGRVKDMLPIVFESDGVTVGGRKCVGTDIGAIFVCPNPFNPEHRLVVYGTVSQAALREMNAVFHGPTDYVVFNNATRKLPDRGAPEQDCFLIAGAFDQSNPQEWKVDEGLQHTPAAAQDLLSKVLLDEHPRASPK